MMQNAEIERFYTDLEALGLRFPNKALAEATGFSKGNVSEYLSRKKVPSKAFLEAFYKAFGSSINVPREKAEKQKLSELSAVVAVLLDAVAQVIAASSGENVTVVKMRLQKAAEDIRDSF